MSHVPQNKPLISALIVTYNRIGHIARAIDSILAQIIPVSEIIVVDDGSTDGTSEFVASQYGPRVRLVRQENGGVSRARRRAVQEARGTWIAFLDSDDEWTPDRTRRLTEAIAAVPKDVAWVFGDLQIVTDKSSETTLFQEYGLKLDREVQLFRNPLAIHHPFQFCMLQSSLIRRDALLSCDCFAYDLRHSEDLLAGYQIATRYRFAAVPSVVTRLYRTSELNRSSLTTNQQLRPDYYKARMLSFSLTVKSGKKQPWSELYANAVRGLCKYCAENNLPIRSIAFQQFKHSHSLTSILFFCLCMPGSRFLQATRALYRKIKNSSNHNGKSGLLPRLVMR